MACIAVLSYFLTIRAGMDVVVAAETAGEIGMSDVQRILAPGDVHSREDVPLPDREYLPSGLRDVPGVIAVDVRILLPIELFEGPRDARGSGFPRTIGRLQEFESFLLCVRK